MRFCRATQLSESLETVSHGIATTSRQILASVSYVDFLLPDLRQRAVARSSARAVGHRHHLALV
ncbi:protein of unknown function [Burkholderia multivorans]